MRIEVCRAPRKVCLPIRQRRAPWALPRILLISSFFFVIAGCGGGGDGGNESGQPPVTTELIDVVSATVVADTSVPLTARSLVTEVLSSQGSGSLGSSIIVPNDARIASDVTMALNEASEIMLASVESPTNGRIELNARSTSIALVRLAIGPSRLPVADLDTAISREPSLSELQALIQSALDRGIAPSTDRMVAESVANVINNLGSVLSESTTLARGVPLAIPSPRIEQAPFTLIDGGLGMGAVEFGGANSTSLFWSLSVEGDVLTVGPGERIPAYGSASGAPYTLLLGQTPDTRTLNVREVFRTGLLAALSLAVTDPGFTRCVNQASTFLLNSTRLAPIVSSNDPGALDAYLNDLRRTIGPNEVRVLGQECSARGSNLEMIKRLFAATWFGRALKAGTIAIRWKSFAQTYSQTFLYWNARELDFGVCVDQSRGITSCATRFAVEPALHLIPGAYVRPEYLAYSGSQRTGLAASIRYSSLMPELLEVDFSSGGITALRPGNGIVRVIEPISEESSDISVNVVNPVLDGPETVGALSTFVDFRLIHPVGNTPLITMDAPVVWSVSDESVLRRFSSGSGGARFFAVSPGVVTVSATLLSTGLTLTRTVHVQAPEETRVAQLLFIFQLVNCDLSQTASLSISDSQGIVFSQTGAHTNSSCGPGNLGEPGMVVGPFNVELIVGRQYTATFNWSGSSGTRLSGLNVAYELNAPLPVSFYSSSQSSAPNTPADGEIVRTFTIR